MALGPRARAMRLAQLSLASVLLCAACSKGEGQEGSAAGSGGVEPADGSVTGAAGGSGGVLAGTSGIAGAGGGGGAAGAEDGATALPDSTPPAGTSGCGAIDFPAGGSQRLDVDGLPRDFIVALPDGYDPSTPHALVFAWHGQRGTAAQIAAFDYYGLRSRAGGTAIFVAAQGLDTTTGIGGTGWDNMNGRDVAFTRAMLAWLRERYCIDDERIFSVGMSYGGVMSNTVGCEMGDVFRAIAPMAGIGPVLLGGPGCVGQVATWIAYGDMDELVPPLYIDLSRDYWVGANHCDATTEPAGSHGCVAYQGCDEGHPVIWCLFSGGHTVPAFASEEIWAFFSQF